MAKQTTFNEKELCLHLLKTETEEEVITILKNYGFWEDRSAWKPYGDMQNNRSIVGNQQNSAVEALVDQKTNRPHC